MPRKNQEKSLNNIDRGFLFMQGPEIRQKEEIPNLSLKIAKVGQFLQKEIIFRFEFTIKPKEK